MSDTPRDVAIVRPRENGLCPICTDAPSERIREHGRTVAAICFRNHVWPVSPFGLEDVERVIAALGYEVKV